MASEDDVKVQEVGSSLDDGMRRAFSIGVDLDDEKRSAYSHDGEVFCFIIKALAPAFDKFCEQVPRGAGGKISVTMNLDEPIREHKDDGT